MSFDIMKKLQEPFPPDQIEWRIDRVFKTDNGDYAYVLAYVTNRAIMQRLDEVFGAYNWQNQYKEWKQKGQVCGISAYDQDKKEWVTKWDGADDTNIESTKGGLSDSMKRAAVQWGIGRYLYGLEQCKVEIKARGQNYINAETKRGSGNHVKGYWDDPQLPTWALPEGYRQEVHKQPNANNEQNTTEQPKKPEKPEKLAQKEFECSDCKEKINEAEYNYSLKNYEKHLCRKCQGNYTKKKSA